MSSTDAVSPGQLLSNDRGFMRGHGTYCSQGALYSSLAGTVCRVNKLLSVKASRTRYTAEIGDVVLGRIIEIGSKRWKVDCNSRQDSALLLSSIHLPGAIQRRKSESDELQMRSFYAEGEILVAEVQTLYQDGAIGIHTRNTKYGKLVNGELIIVQSSLVRRSPTHFAVFDWGVEVILGLNGLIWIGKPRASSDNSQDLDLIYSSKVDDITSTMREAIARTRNCIIALNRCGIFIEEDSIRLCYKKSLQMVICDIPQMML